MMHFNLFMLVLAIWLPYCKSVSNITIFNSGEGMKEELTRSSYLRSSEEDLYRYLKYEEVMAFVNDAVSKHSKYLSSTTIACGKNNRDTVAVVISNVAAPCKYVNVLEPHIDNSHLITTNLMLYTITEILKDPRLLNDSIWVIIPIAEAENYYDKNAGRRHRRAKEKCAFKRLENVEITNPCVEKTLMDYIGISNVLEYAYRYKDTLQTYISVQGYGTKILYPSGPKKEPIFDWVELERCATQAQYVVKRNFGLEYQIGTIKEKRNILDSGGIVQCMKEKVQVPFTYIVKLPGKEIAGDVPETEIKRVLSQTYPLIRGLSQCSARYYRK